MQTARKPDVAAIFDDGRAVERAARKAVAQAIRRHKLLGESIAVGGPDGEPIVIPAEEIPDEWTRVEPDA